MIGQFGLFRNINYCSHTYAEVCAVCGSDRDTLFGFAMEKVIDYVLCEWNTIFILYICPKIDKKYFAFFFTH